MGLRMLSFSEGFGGFGSPPKQMVGILMTHQHGPLDFDPTATIIITFSGTLLFVAVGSKSNGPCWWVMRIPTICLGGDPNPVLGMGGHASDKERETEREREGEGEVGISVPLLQILDFMSGRGGTVREKYGGTPISLSPPFLSLNFLLVLEISGLLGDVVFSCGQREREVEQGFVDFGQLGLPPTSGKVSISSYPHASLVFALIFYGRYEISLIIQSACP